MPINPSNAKNKGLDCRKPMQIIYSRFDERFDINHELFPNQNDHETKFYGKIFAEQCHSLCHRVILGNTHVLCISKGA